MERSNHLLTFEQSLRDRVAHHSTCKYTHRITGASLYASESSQWETLNNADMGVCVFMSNPKYHHYLFLYISVCECFTFTYDCAPHVCLFPKARREYQIS